MPICHDTENVCDKLTLKKKSFLVFSEIYKIIFIFFIVHNLIEYKTYKLNMHYSNLAASGMFFKNDKVTEIFSSGSQIFSQQSLWIVVAEIILSSDPRRTGLKEFSVDVVGQEFISLSFSWFLFKLRALN